MNVQEAVAFRTAAKRAASDPNLQFSRIPILLDSQVVKAIIARGRSSSHSLNRIMVSATAFMLFAGLTFLPFWIASAFNAADDGTRGRLLRRAKKCPAALKQLIWDTAASLSWPLFIHRSVRGARRRIFVDFFSGRNSPLAAAFKRRGWEVVAVDVLIGGEAHNLCLPDVLARWTQWILENKQLAAFLAPPCSSFSQWLRLAWW